MRHLANWAMTPRRTVTTRSRSARRAAAVAGLVAAAGALVGCEHDSYMDPSVMGRWEMTPTTVPILERIAAVEGPADENVASSKVRPEDLIPEVDAYRVGPGDVLEITIQDLFRTDFQERFEREIDPRGYLDLPEIPSVNINNLTSEEARDAIGEALKQRQILTQPKVAISIKGRRKLTFNLIGGVERPGLYAIPKPDYRLLEGLPAGGRFSESVQFVYVIRQIPLSDSVTGRKPAPAAGPATPAAPGTPEKPKDNMIDLIDDLSKPKDKGNGAPKPSPSPSVMRPVGVQPRDPAVDLDDPTRATAKPRSESAPSTDGPADWQFINGQWVKTGRAPASGDAPAPEGGAAEALMTQRVIQIPMAALVAGNQQYNIVIRPGDVIRVPAPPEGLVYVTGQVERPGPYNMPSVGRLTVLRAIDAAGGLGQLAIPERVDLTRMVGPDRQATIRLNLRAISEGTQPDIFLRSDDRINVGSNFFALPMAVVRNGMRASYGYGFILDRNFGYDVFGPQNQNTGF